MTPAPIEGNGHPVARVLQRPEFAYPARLSDVLYDAANVTTDRAIDRLCDVVQVLIQGQSRETQIQCLAALGRPEPNPNQQELFQ